jgi:peptidoglycan/xylan/chitin deacetylase (PgdA/CDA1 family)
MPGGWKQEFVGDRDRLTMIFRHIPNKREFLARAFGQAGVLDLLEQTIARRRPGLIVLTYHRIAEIEMDPFYTPVISATPESFRTQIQWLHNRMRMITLDELIDQVAGGLSWREPVMLLTFDDGYRDNFEFAAPLLREQNVPATFFIPTGFVELPKLPWWDHIAYVIKQTHVRRFVVDRCSTGRQPPLEIDLEAMSQTTAIASIIRAFLDETIPDEQWFLDRLTQVCLVEFDSEALGRNLFMSWANVHELADSSLAFTIGSHTHSHRKLATLDIDAQRDELARSKQILQAKLERPIKALAYPYGWPGTYTSQTKVLATEAGYEFAFSTREGVNPLDDFDRYEVKRLGVGSSDTPALLRARSTLHAAFGKSFL